MDSLVSLININQVVNNKSQKPSLTSLNNNSISSLPRVSNNSFEIIKDGYEPFKLEGNDKVFSPIISNKDNSNTRKTQKDNSNSDSFIENEFSPKELTLEFLSQQTSTQPSSLFPAPTAGRKLSTIAEQTEFSTTIQQSNLESQLLKPTTTLSRSSSSDGSVSSKESERDLSVSGEEMNGQEDSCLTN